MTAQNKIGTKSGARYSQYLSTLTLSFRAVVLNTALRICNANIHLQVHDKFLQFSLLPSLGAGICCKLNLMVHFSLGAAVLRRQSFKFSFKL